MDLSLDRPRRIAVRFETAPPDRPDQIDTHYTAPLAAWLEPGEHPGETRVTIDARMVERYLFGDQNPVPGSFGDFVWIFDAASGQVRSAEVSGRLRHHIAWGHFVETPVWVHMDTLHIAGFAPPQRLLGHVYRSYCGREDPECTLVRARSYDPRTGYVNAVGEIVARQGPLQVRSFSPLGEAVFNEWPDEGLPPVSAASTPVVVR
jgi:hypothetical protein